MATVNWWRARARDAMSDLLRTHGALLKMEVEARVAERPYLKIGKPIDPHHLSAALVHLEATGHLVKTVKKTALLK